MTVSSGPRGPDVLFWLLKAPRMCRWCAYIHVSRKNTHTHQIKMSLKTFKWKKNQTLHLPWKRTIIIIFVLISQIIQCTNYLHSICIAYIEQAISRWFEVYWRRYVNYMQISMPFYVKDLSISGCWRAWGFWNQSLADNEGWLYNYYHILVI